MSDTSETFDTGDTGDSAPDAGAGRYYKRSDFVSEPETPEPFEGTGSVKRAAAELSERRQRPAPIKKRDARTLPREMKIGDAADTLKLSRQIESGIDLVNAGIGFDDAVEQVKAGEPPPTEVEYTDKDKGPVNARQAAKDLGEYREHQRALAAQALAEQQQGLAAPPPAPEAPAAPIEQPQQQPDHAAERQKIEQEWARLEQLRSLSAAEVTARLEIDHLKSKYQGIENHVKSHADLEALARANPEGFRQLVADDARVRQREAELQQIAQHKHASELIANQRNRAAEEQAIAKAYEETSRVMAAEVPELNDPARVESTLRNAGLTAEMLAADSRLRWQLADPAVQRVLVKAVRYDMAQSRAHEVTRAPLPQVQRPGVAQPHGAAQAATIERAGRRLDSATSSRAGLFAAADILKARRAAHR